jgi:hypothetical protein
VLALHRSGEPDVLGRYSTGYARLLACALAGCIALTLANHRRLLARIVVWRRELLLLPVSIGIGLLVCELVLRLFDPVGIGYYSEMRRYEQDRVPDERLSYRHPRATTRRYQGVELRYNELGLRDDPIAAKAPGEFRVLVLGDSVALGWGVRQEETFSAVLERQLAADLPGPVRVINTGVCSYNTVMELAWLREHGFALDPDLVLLLYVPNDVVTTAAIWAPEANASESEHPHADLAMSVLGRSWLVRLLLHLDRARTPRSVPGDPSEPGWQASMQALRELVADAQARDVGVAVFLWTWGGSADADQAALHAALGRAAAPVPVEETGSWFAGESIAQLANSRIDPHPNARAHARLAEGMQRSLRANSLLPGKQKAPGLDGDRGPFTRGASVD